MTNPDVLLSVDNLTVCYDKVDNSESNKKGDNRFVAVRKASFELQPGHILGIVGESGSGKSTLVKALVGFVSIESGSIMMCGQDISNVFSVPAKQRCELYRNIQMVFQNPQASFDSRRTLGYSAMEGLRNTGVSRKEALTRVTGLFERCGLDGQLMDRYPSQVSGGQCQRVAIVRAVAMRPKLLICDEPTSALDTLAQAQIVSLIRDLRDDSDMSVLFVCHDLALAQELCDDLVVMHAGEIVERGHTSELIAHPQHPYTRSLLESARAVSL